MTKGELAYLIAVWATAHTDDIDLEDWTLGDSHAKKELNIILEKANCENICMNTEKVMPNIDTRIVVPHDKKFAGFNWVGNDLVLHYKEK